MPPVGLVTALLSQCCPQKQTLKWKGKMKDNKGGNGKQVPASCGLHAEGRTCENIRACSHCATYENRLPRQLVVHRDEGVVGRKCPGGALTMHQQPLELAVDNVLFHLGIARQGDHNSAPAFVYRCNKLTSLHGTDAWV